MYYGGYLPAGKRIYIREDRALDLIGEAIQEAQFPDWLAQEGVHIAREIIAENEKNSGSALRKAQKEISDIEAMLNKLLDLHLSGGIDKATYLERARQLQTRKATAQDVARSSLQDSETTREEPERVIFGMRDLPELYAKGTARESKDSAGSRRCGHRRGSGPGFSPVGGALVNSRPWRTAHGSRKAENAGLPGRNSNRDSQAGGMG